MAVVLRLVGGEQLMDDLMRKCAECGRKVWLGYMFWRDDVRVCSKCTREGDAD